MSQPVLEIDGLTVALPPTESGHETGEGGPRRAIPLLDGVSLTVAPGDVHAVVGSTGSATAGLAPTLLGSPNTVVTAGRIRLDGDDITDWSPDVRAKAGLFLAFEDPLALAGVSLLTLVRRALGARVGDDMGVPELREVLRTWADRFGLDTSFVERATHDELDQVERRWAEVLLLAVLEPKVAVLDGTGPTDDPAALDVLVEGLRVIRAERSELAVLAVTHHPALIRRLRPDRIHVLLDGRLVESGGHELGRRLVDNGLEGYR